MAKLACWCCNRQIDKGKFCDDCRSVLDFHYKQLRADLEEVYQKSNGNEMWECEVIESIAEYAEVIGDEYNTKLKEERKVSNGGKQGSHQASCSDSAGSQIE